ncbi:hypothetical protein [[Mycobacterium] burgundiense]|uniref:Transmembrane protein n=1 Tax=[Mycobacterium] burgundiense TaxID=3064286 RepID=A0ABN9NMH7_9MYCO|nr:hypothetical protein [Mycolicibacterium sp. MU0053]CAJ1508983.1 hypothetical protein MU0053_004032 [Mycolicibacterium sp. MU0053]
MPESKSPWFTPPRLDTGSMPLTEPHPAPIFDTGPHPQPLSLWGGPEESAATEAELDDAARDIADDDSSDLDERSEPVPVPAQPTVVPGQLIAVKRWKFILLTLGVWAVAAAAGAGFYYWWFQSLDKAWPEFAVLMAVIVCTVAALLMAMVQDRPLVAVTSIAVLTTPFAVGLGAAALYGMYVFRWITP